MQLTHNRFMVLAWSLVFLLLGTAHIMPVDYWYWNGVSIGDGLFLLLGFMEAFSLTKKDSKLLFEARFMLAAMGVALVSLGLSSFINFQSYMDYRPEYTAWIFRLAYFAAMIPVIAYVVAHRLTVQRAVNFYVTGMAAALLLNLINDFVLADPNERFGLYIWSNPNVIGNFACMGLLYMALWLKHGAKPYIAYVLMLLLLGLSGFLSFSKASWIMLILGIVILIVQSRQCCINLKAQMGGRVPFLENPGYVCIVALASLFTVLFLQGPKVVSYVNLKIISSPPSLEIRKNYALSSWEILKNEPMGIGVGRYVEYTTGASVSKSEAAQVGTSSAGNPHSALLYLAASGGWGAFLGFVCFIGAFAYSFVRAVMPFSSKCMSVLVGGAFVATIFVSASFQLQAVTQNYLYVLAGIVVASALKPASQNIRL